MTADQIWELIGYLGSLLVLVSMFMTSIVKLRLVNTVGSIIFCIYAIAIHSIPTAFMNGALVLVNIWNLVKLNRFEKEFTMFEAGTDDAALLRFLDTMKDDIAKYFPDFKGISGDMKAYMVYQDMTIAGIVVGKADGETLDIVLDYTTPNYRDFSVGKFVYAELKKSGYGKLTCRTNTVAHIAYLLKMGFADDGNKLYTKELG